MPLQVPSAQEVEQTTLQLPGAQPLGDNGLGAIAQGAGVAADEFRKAEVEQARKRNASKVFEAEVQLEDLYRTKQAEARARRGSDAHGVTNEVSGWWETEPAKIESTLENATQRELFAQSVAKRRAVSLDSFSTHEANEANAAVSNAAQAKTTAAIETGAAEFDNPEALSLAVQDIDDAVGVQASLGGWGKDQRENARLDATTKLHSQVIENLIDQDPSKARTYFEQNKKAIAGSTWDGIEAKLTSGTDIRAAQNAADDIWSRGLSETEAYAAARKELDGKSREQALSLLKQQFAEQEAAKNEYRKGKVEEARAAFDEGGIRSLTPSMIETLQRVAPNELRAMRSTTPQDQVATNWDVYDGLLKLAKDSRNEFGQDTDLDMFRADLNARELGELKKLQADIREDRQSPTGTLTQILGEVDWADREQKGQFDRSVREAILLEQNITGKPPTEIRMREIVREQMTEVRVPRWWWTDRQVPRFEVEREAVQKIPDSEREIIGESLRRRGLPVTDAAVLRLYQAGQEE